GQTISIQGLDGQTLLQLLAHPLGPGFRAEESYLQGAFGGIDTLFFHLIDDIETVGRRHRYEPRPEILDQLDLSFRLAAGHGDHGATQAFRTVMEAQPTGKQAITVSY